MLQPEGGVNCLVFSPDGRTLASGHGDGVVRLWDARLRSVQRMLNGHTGAVRSLASAPDGALLASGGADGVVRWWEGTRVMSGTESLARLTRVSSVPLPFPGSFVFMQGWFIAPGGQGDTFAAP